LIRYDAGAAAEIRPLQPRKPGSFVKIAGAPALTRRHFWDFFAA
jgi:hypothetical protein